MQTETAAPPSERKQIARRIPNKSCCDFRAVLAHKSCRNDTCTTTRRSKIDCFLCASDHFRRSEIALGRIVHMVDRQRRSLADAVLCSARLSCRRIVLALTQLMSLSNLLCQLHMSTSAVCARQCSTSLSQLGVIRLAGLRLCVQCSRAHVVRNDTSAVHFDE